MDKLRNILDIWGHLQVYRTGSITMSVSNMSTLILNITRDWTHPSEYCSRYFYVLHMSCSCDNITRKWNIHYCWYTEWVLPYQNGAWKEQMSVLVQAVEVFFRHDTSIRGLLWSNEYSVHWCRERTGIQSKFDRVKHLADSQIQKGNVSRPAKYLNPLTFTHVGNPLKIQTFSSLFLSDIYKMGNIVKTDRT